MGRTQKIILLFSLLCLVGAAGFFLVKEKTPAPSCPAYISQNLIKFSGRIQSSKPFQITYAFRLGGNLWQSQDLITTDLSEHPRLRYIKYLGEGRFAEDEKFPRIATEHAREIIPLLFQGKHAFVVADHGFDVPPYKGGQPRIVVEEKGIWKDQTASLFPVLRSFNFNVSALKSLTGNELFFSVVSNEKEFPFVLKENPSARNFQLKDLLPHELKSSALCLMSSRPLPTEGPAQYLVLGGCDRPELSPGNAHDRILRFQNEKFELLPAENLPPRKPDSTWGSVDLRVGDLNGDHFPDVVAAVHNFGFSQGALQIYLNTGKEMKFREPEQSFLMVTDKSKTSFVPFVHLGDLDGDGYPELIAPIVGIFKNNQDPHLKQKFALYQNHQGERFDEISMCLNSTLNTVMDADFGDLDANGKADVFLLSHDGSYEIFYNRKRE